MADVCATIQGTPDLQLPPVCDKRTTDPVGGEVVHASPLTGRIVLSRDHANHVFARLPASSPDAEGVIGVLLSEMQSTEEELRRLNTLILHKMEVRETILRELRRRDNGSCD